MQNKKVYSSFTSMDNDQRLLTARLPLSLRKSETQAKKNNYVWSTLQNKDLQEFYTISMHIRYAELSSSAKDITEIYGKLIKAKSDTADMLKPVKQKMKRRKLSEDHRIAEERTDVQKAFVIYQQNCSVEAQKELKNKKHKPWREDAYNVIQEEQQEVIGKHQEDADARNKHEENWKLTNKIKS